MGALKATARTEHQLEMMTAEITVCRFWLACAAIAAVGAWSTVATGGVSATGGEAYNSGIYRVHVFTSTAAAANFTVTVGGDIEVLVVAGGGGGGWDVGGGGGAGGVLYTNPYPVIVSNYIVSVGGGGPGATGSGLATGQNGTNSSFGPLVAIGGGGGGNYSGGSGTNGGSGGGGSGYTVPGDRGFGTAGQGNDGGAKSTVTGNSNLTGSGGGGAGGVGSTGILNISSFATGGLGVAYSIAGSSVVYAVGGRGAGDNWVGMAPGGASTGNGGDGGGNPNTGKSGGSGIVIVRYLLGLTVDALPATDAGTTNATLNGMLASDGGGTAPEIFLCWGFADSGTASTGDWPNVTYMGNTWTNGQPFSNIVYNLNLSETCFYRCYATNSLGTAWSDPQSVTPFSKTWIGSSDANWFTATNWSPEGVPADGDAVLISSAYSTTNVLLTNSTAQLGQLVISNRTLTFSNWTTAIYATNMVVRTNGILTHTSCNTNPVVGNSNRVYIVCRSNLTIQTGGKIDVAAKGYAGGQGPGAANSIDGSGGGYGGAGGRRSAGGHVAGVVYGLASAPLGPGSGGGTYAGGAVMIDASNGTVLVDGLITADGGNGGGGGGSGGGIHIICRNYAGSNGVIRAIGGKGTYAGSGGGRVAVSYDAAAQAASLVPGVFFTVHGNTNESAIASENGQVGSLYLTDTLVLPQIMRWSACLNFQAATTNWSPASLTVTNCYVWWPTNVMLVLTNDLVVNGSARFTATNAAGLNVGGNVTLANTGRFTYGFADGYAGGLAIGSNLFLTNGSSLYLYAGRTNGSAINYGGCLNLSGRYLTIPTNCTIYPISHPTNGGSIKLVVSNLTIAAGGTINADYNGFAPTFGPGRYPSGDSSAAGYGGKGGTRSGYPPGGPAYGTSNAPIDPGSGAGGAGGGAVRIEASGTITVDGTITANGDPTGGGAGSGGGVFLASRAFTGGGTIRANGGTGSWAGGGGGRIGIALDFSDADVANLIAGIAVPGFRIYTNHPPFTGALAVVQGSNGSPPADPGTKQFMTDHATGMTVMALSAASVGVTNATLNGKLTGDGGDTNTTVAFCYGYADAGAISTGDWPNVISMGGGWKEVSSFSNILNDLLSGSSYVYRCYATNLAGEVWSATQGFTTIYPPLTTNLGCIGFEGTYILRGQVTDVGASLINPDCWFYYWQVGGATSIVAMGQQPLLTTFTTNLTGLPLLTPYRYAILASNVAGTTWSTTSDFTTDYYLQPTKTWIGSSDMNWFTTTNWSPEGVPADGDSVRIDSLYSTTNVLLTNSTAVLGQLVISNRTLTSSNWLTAIRATNIFIRTNGVLNLPPAFTTNQMSNRVYILCYSNLTIQPGGSINADGAGWVAVQGPGRAANIDGSGAGYGGRGGIRSSSYAPGYAYGSISAPLDPGSGGGSSGGGAVWVAATGAIVRVDGVISANGSSSGGGGGSGGGIFIECLAFDGSNGIVRALGGKGTYAGSAGGRIAVVYDAAAQAAYTPAPTVLFMARGNTNEFATASQNGALGSLYFTDTRILDPLLVLSGSLYFNAVVTNWAPVSMTLSNNACIEWPTNVLLAVTNDLTLSARSKLVVTNANGLSLGGTISILSTSEFHYGFASAYPAALSVGSNVFLTNGSSFYLFSGRTNGTLPYGGLLNLAGRDLTVPTNCAIYPYSDPFNGGSIKMLVRNLTVSGGGSINADGRGYMYTNGPGKHISNDASGAGYGGQGGTRPGYSAGGSPYGSSNAPVDPGSGAGNYGGGLVRVEATGAVTVNGLISANGAAGGGGAGSGGGIYIAAIGRFVGESSGILRANGGTGTYAGSGGGRIAVWYRVSETARTNYLAGQPGDVISFTNCPDTFLGIATVTNGLNGSPVAQPGTCLFFTIPLYQGTVYKFF